MLSRRTFVAWVAGAIPVALVTRRADALGSAWIVGEEETMRALAEAVLPSELGVAGAARVAKAFRLWIGGYAEHVELVHGYGTSALRFSSASQKPNWAVQLERLGARDLGPGTMQFAEMSHEQRRAAVRDELKNERVERMPAVGAASHVAVALLAFYYATPEATDLCYNAQIGRTMCRPLEQSSRKPLPIAGARP